MTQPNEPLYKTIDPDWLKRQYHDEGLSIPQIAERLHMPRNVVYHAVCAHNLNLNRRAIARLRSKYPDIDPDLIRSRYHDAGLTIPEVAAELGVPHWHIMNIMRREGIPRRPSWNSGKRAHTKPWHDPNWLKSMHYDQDLTYQKIADVAGCHLQTIAAAMRRHNIPGRRGGHTAQPVADDTAGACWSCPYREDCLDWPVETPCKRLELERRTNDD